MSTAGMNRVRLYAAEHGVTIAQLQGPQQHRQIAHLRQDLYRELHDTGLYSTPEIGRLLGNRDHTTVLYGIRKSRERLMNQLDFDRITKMRTIGMRWSEIKRAINYQGEVASLTSTYNRHKRGDRTVKPRGRPPHQIHEDYRPAEISGCHLQASYAAENIPERSIPWSDRRPFTRKELTDMQSAERFSGCGSSMEFV